MQCQNNLKQLGLACHNYHGTHDSFPAGTIRDSAAVPEERLSLFVSLLPFLEQDQFARQIDHKQGWQADSNTAATRARLKVLMCGTVAVNEADPVTYFVGVAGEGSDAATLALTDTRCGFFGYDRTITKTNVKDGLSNTLMFIDPARDVGPWAAGGASTVRGIDPEGTPLIGEKGAFGRVHSMSRWNFGRVKVLASVAMGDGSTRRVSEAVSAEVLAALATVAGNESLPSSW